MPSILIGQILPHEVSSLPLELCRLVCPPLVKTGTHHTLSKFGSVTRWERIDLASRCTLTRRLIHTCYLILVHGLINICRQACSINDLICDKIVSGPLS